MIFQFDIDDTISIKCGDDYTIDSLPNQIMIDLVNQLYDKGHIIKLVTSRKMLSSGDNPGLALAKSGYNTFKWLEKYNVKFHQIFFTKPHSDVIIDNSAFGYQEHLIREYLQRIINESN